MFYDIKILCPQKKGRFANCWIACTLGIKKLTKKEILSCNILKTCDEILEMIMSQSHRPKQRLSLRLAATLINGTVKIHHQQVTILLDDLVMLLCQSRGPKIFKEPKERKVHQPRTKPKRVVVTSEESEPIVEMQQIVTEAVVEPVREKEVVSGYHELVKVIDFNSEPVEEIERLQQMRQISQASVTEEVVQFPAISEEQERPLAVPLEEEPIKPPETPKKARRKETAHEEALETPKKRRRTEARKEDVPEIEVVPKPAPAAQVVPEPAPKEAVEIEEVPDVEKRKSSPRKAKIPRRRGDPLVTIVHKRVKINRIPSRFDKWRYENYIPYTYTRMSDEPFNIVPLLEEFFEGQEEALQFVEAARLSPRTSSSIRASASLLRQSARSTVTPTVSKTTPVVPQYVEKEIPMQEPMEIEETPVPSAEIVQATPVEKEKEISRKKRRIETEKKRTEPEVVEAIIEPAIQQVEVVEPPVPVEPTVPEIREREVPERVERSPAVSERSDVRRQMTEERQKNMVIAIRKWNVEREGMITIEHVCQKPINRYNIAVAFDDLLQLAKMRYVVLNSKPDSIELGTIEKGEKLLRRERK